VAYIEVTPQDIALANRLADTVLGRSLDELPPQTRRLLHIVDALVRRRQEEQGLDRADVRVIRREVREECGWGDTQLKVHLARLVDLESFGWVNERASDADVRAAETVVGTALPPDYRATIMRYNGGEGWVAGRAYLRLWPVNELEDHRVAMDLQVVPAMVVLIGSGWGG
jgi:hypothetical protein